MISVTAVSSASGAGDYYSQDNYYSQSELADGSCWEGKGAVELGLSGQVDPVTFTDVLSGKLPDGTVLKAAHGDHRPGLDLTCSAPKSVSLVALLGGDERVVTAFREAVSATLGWVEKNLIETRVWDPNSKHQIVEKTGNLVAATFLHDVNRNNEPQLHVHAVIANATKASDGKWHALHNDELYRNQHLIGAIQNAELRTRLNALGYETVLARNPIDGAFEIKGVPREVIEAFSTRRSEILASLKEGDRGSAREREIAALSTRQSKNPEFTPEARRSAWQATADQIGFNPGKLVETAFSFAANGGTPWSRLVEGVRTIAARGMAFAAAMGVTPRDGDPLVPERSGRLDPQAFASAQAVASAARELGEREAAFPRNDLIRAALERGGPVTVSDVEARLAVLCDKGILHGGDRLMTTQAAIALEQRVIDLAKAGSGLAPPLSHGADLAARLQQTAREQGLRRLNPGQEQTGVTLLQSTNRVELVQGAAGVGKSAALAPVARIAAESGRNVMALAHAGRTARDFGAKIGAPAATIDSFLGRYQRVITGAATGGELVRARQALSGAVIMVDESSQIGNERLGKLIALANTMDVARLVLAGDVKQLPAIEAGKPFALLQQHDLPTSVLTENLRAQSPQMIGLNAALERGDIGDALKTLKPDTIEVPQSGGPAQAALLWSGLSKDERENTLLLASGRAMRAAANTAVQDALRGLGEIRGHGLRLTVLDRVTVTREGARQIRGYQDSRTVEFRTNLIRQGFACGEKGIVLRVTEGEVQLAMSDGSERVFRPDRLPRNLAHDAVSIHQDKHITLYEGDRIRWTDNDRDRGLLNGDIARVDRIDGDLVSVTARNGDQLALSSGDRMLERLDLAYAINVHVAQGMTAQNGIILMSEREKMLNTTQSFLVAVTRIAEHATLIVDNVAALERDVTKNPGGKTAASDALPSRTDAQPAAALPVPEKALDLTL